MTDWREVKLSDVCNLIAGFAFKSKDFGDYSDKVIKITNIEPPFVNMDNLVGVNLSNYKKDKLEKFMAYPGEYVLAMTGATIGKLGRICCGRAYINQRILLFRPTEYVDNRFLYYILSRYQFSQYILNHIDSESAQPNISANTIGKYSFLLPPLEVQRKIAGVLGVLDDKIELNNKINQNLELQAQALFKSWFVDFEPFGGTMPSDWKNGKVDDIIELFDSQRIPLSGNQRENMQKIYPYYGATSLMDYVDNYIFDGKYLLLGEDGTVIDDKGFPVLQYIWGKFWVNNHAHILRGKNGFNVESLYLFFKQTNIKSIVTGAVQPKVNQANLRALPAIIPNLDIMKKFNETIEPLFSLIRNNRDENTRLEKLRDTLLPKLMSGEIDVDNVEISDGKE